MKTECVKAVTIRFYSNHDSDLIEMAVKQSGLAQSEWARHALILSAESQVMNGGPLGQILKNTLLTRRLTQMFGNFSNDQIAGAMKWSTAEYEKIFKLNKEN